MFLGQERVYTMRELAQDTSAVVAGILATGQRALLTKRGQFIVAIQPLAPGEMESRAASAIAEYLGDGSEEGGGALPSGVAAARLHELAKAPQPPGDTSTVGGTKSAAVYTMRELSQNTAGVIAAIVDSGDRALLTKRGQFIAAIQPLDPGVIESQVASAIADYLGDGSREGGDAVSTKFAAAMMGIDTTKFD
jgi:antitoxin (DNA-binding transcriptional repressor) of toxin-antitoxin stability system